MFNAGTGLICAQGRGKDVFVSMDALPTECDVPFQSDPFLVYAVPPSLLKDRAVLGWMRRADRFSKMAMLASHDAFAAANICDAQLENVGIILATAFGPHATTFRFLDEILDYGDAAVSPTIFSNSVHNAAISYISKAMGIKGPTLTMTCFKNAFEQALQLASLWLDSGRCEYVLLGGGDECGTTMEYIYKERIAAVVRSDGTSPVIPGEGFAFFMLSNKHHGSEFVLTEKSYQGTCGHLFSGKALDCAIESLKNKHNLNVTGE